MYKKIGKYAAVFLAVIVLVSPMVSLAQQSDVDPLGENVSCANISHPLRYGARDVGDASDVSVLQDFLNSNGYLSVTASGFFGKATLKAVKTFQLQNGLASTGYVGPLTITKIHDLDCSTGNNDHKKDDVVINDHRTVDCPVYAYNMMYPAPPHVPNPTLVQVLSPNGGENLTLAPGDKVSVTWGTCNVAPYAPVDVSITNGMSTYSLTHGQTISNSGTFNYVVPEVPRVMQNVVYGNHFKVVVTVCPIRETIVVDTHPQPCVSDSSDAEFSIMPRNVNDTVYAPTVKTGVVSYGSGDNNGPGVFVANGTIVTTGNSQIVSEYIKYGTTPGSGTTGATASVVMGGDFTALFPGSCTQPLYYEAYAVNAAGFTGHGEEVYGSNVRCNNVATTTVATWTTGTVTSVSNCGSFTLQSDGVAVGNSIHAGAIYTVHAPCDTRPGSYNKTKWPYDVSVGDRVSVFGVITDTTISAQDIHNGNVEIIRQRFI